MDQAYTSKYLGVARMLWNASENNADIPQHYLDHLQYTYSDGSISLAHLLGKFEFTEGLEPEEIEEAIELLGRVNPEDWPYTEDIQGIDIPELLSVYEEDASEFSYAEDNLDITDKLEKVLISAISSVFGATVSNIRSRKGHYADTRNDFLREEDGTFCGFFTYDNKKFAFEVAPSPTGWIVSYRMDAKEIDKLPELLQEDKPKDPKEGYKRSPVRNRGWK